MLEHPPTQREVMSKTHTRRRRRLIIIIGSALAVAVLIGCPVAIVFWIAAAVSHDAIDEYRIAQGAWELRVRALSEGDLGFSAPGGIYHYECRSTSAAAWRPITSFRYSHPNMIPRGQVRFVGSSCVYFFHEFVFGVSTDGGITWIIRGEPERSFNTLHQWAFPRIDSVTINEDGSGVMHVSPYRWQTLTSTELTTDDFGKTWK